MQNAARINILQTYQETNGFFASNVAAKYMDPICHKLARHIGRQVQFIDALHQN